MNVVRTLLIGALAGGAALLFVFCHSASPPVTAAPRMAVWSDPRFWQGRPPQAGASVTVPAGVILTLDMNPPPLGRLRVDGALVFANRDLHVRVRELDVTGRLQIGTAQAPFTHSAVVTLTGPSADQSSKGVFVTGDLEIHGAPHGASWTRLAASAPAGARTLRLAAAPGWHPGDRIVIASTDYDAAKAEMAVAQRISGNVVTLAAPLRWAHFGRITDGVDERAEVGLLTRSVVVQGDAASERDGCGGQIMIMRPGTAHIENVEFRRMGQAGRLGRYPVHFHLAGDEAGAYVRNCSLRHCYNRAITLHGSDDILVADNVAYDVRGHCYFLEDGVEMGNTLSGNLGIWTRRPLPGRALLPSDATPATFWITNPDNIMRGNVAAGSEGDGFWYNLPVHPTGPSDTPDNERRVHPRELPLGVFSGNVAHSDTNDGLVVDNGSNPPGVFGAPNYQPPVPAVFADMTAYKNRRRGMWLRGRLLTVRGARLADNAIGVTLAASQSVVEGSLCVGTTDNHPSPPKPDDPHFGLVGFEFYDGLVGVRNTTFENFESNPQRGAGALGYLRWSPFFVDPRNWASGLRFVNAQRLFLPPHDAPRPSPAAAKSGSDGYRSAAFVDLDGSVTGQRGANILLNTAFLQGHGARIWPEWGALTTTAPVARLFVEDKDAHPHLIGPVTVTRLDGSRPSTTLWGIPADAGPNTSFQTTVLTGHRYAVAFTGRPPARLRVAIAFCRPGEGVQVTLPSGLHCAPITLTARPARGMGRASATLANGTLHRGG